MTVTASERAKRVEMLHHHDARNAGAPAIPEDLLRWLESPKALSRALVPAKAAARGGKKDDAALLVMERALGDMELRLAETAARHDQALSQIRARLDRLGASVGKVANDQFVNGKGLDRLLSGMAQRVSLLEQEARPAAKRWFSFPGKPRRAA
jgi:hypothetical protein